MRKTFFWQMIPIITAVLFPAMALAYKSPDDAQKTKILPQVYRMQIPFVENRGQLGSKEVNFYANTFGGTVFVTKDGHIIYSLPLFTDSGAKGCVLKERFIGGSFSDVRGEEKAVTRVSYFKGNDPSKWRSNISTYNLISLGEVYEGVEIKLKAYGKKVEKLFYVKPHACSERIKIKMEGAKSLRVNEKGELEVITELGPVKFTKPFAYQEIDGKRVEVEVAYTIQESRIRSQEAEYAYGTNLNPKSKIQNPKSILCSAVSYGFKVGKYNKNLPLIIDPLLASTFLGDYDIDYATTIAVSGDVYVAGRTFSLDFPVSSVWPFFPLDRPDIFVSRLDRDLTTLVSSSFIGGSKDDFATSIDIDSNGDFYMTGYTDSLDFPTKDEAYDTSFNGGQYDVFVLKLTQDLHYFYGSTYLGGSENDYANAIENVYGGNVYVAGLTFSDDFPTTDGAYDTSYDGAGDAFVAMLNSGLTTLRGATFLGGSEGDEVFDVDSIVEDVYVAGWTESLFIPLSYYPENCYEVLLNGGEDAFVARLNSDLTTLKGATYLGSDSTDRAYSIDAQHSAVYIAGDTYSSHSSPFPTTPGAYSRTHSGEMGNYDVFVAKLDRRLGNLLASTYLGGSYDDHANSIKVIISDYFGNYVFVAGSTYSSDLPTTGTAYDRTWNGSRDAFVSRLSDDLSYLQASTFLGGGGNDSAAAIDFDGLMNIYAAGVTDSSNFPATHDAYDRTRNGSDDAFVSKFDISLRGEVPHSSMWNFETGHYVSSSPAVSGGCVYVGSYDKKVYCFNTQNGGKIWDFDTGDFVTSSPVVYEEYVYVGSHDKKVYCLDTQNGNKIWGFRTGGAVHSSPAVSGEYVYVGSRDDKIYCLDAQTGSKVWEFETGHWVDSSPAVSGGRVYVGSNDNKVYCLNAQTGNKEWEFEAGSPVDSSPAITGRYVYVGSDDGKVYCLNNETGEKVWEFDTGFPWVESSPAVSGKYVYVGGSNSKVYCLRAKGLSKVWEFDTHGDVRSSPAVSGGYVYVGSDDNKVYCLNAKTGSKVWEFETGDDIKSSPAVSGGFVYVGSKDKKIYCIYAASGDNGLWPMFCYNTERRGSIAHDLVVESIATNPIVSGNEQVVEIEITVKNQGMLEAGEEIYPVRVSWYHHLDELPSINDNGDLYQDFIFLGAGATQIIHKTYTYETTGEYNMYAQVDSKDSVIETDEANNILGPVSIHVGEENTRKGNYVVVNVEHVIDLTFTEIILEGNTTGSEISCGPSPPGGLVILPLGDPTCYDIETTASYSGAIEVSVEYNESGVDNEFNLRLFTYEETLGYWKDITTSVDTDNNIISGETDHLSQFAVMLGTGSSTTSIQEGTTCYCEVTCLCHDKNENSYCTSFFLDVCTLEQACDYCCSDKGGVDQIVDGFCEEAECPINYLFGINSEQTNLLRDFRDEILYKTPEGQEIIELYYEWSPMIVKAMEVDEEFKTEVKEMINALLPLIKSQME